MARGVARTSSGRAVFSDVPQNGDAPQSTLAAQLVNHLTDGRKHSKNQDQETFRQLLGEILGAESESGSQVQMHESNNDDGYKLIYVLVKAGLETMINEDPFGDQGELSQQALDSLAAVESTLRSNPEVLFVDAPRHVPGTDRHGPLFLWLVPKIIAVTSQSIEKELRQGVLKLFRTILSLERKINKCGARRNSILKYTRGCVKGESAYC